MKLSVAGNSSGLEVSDALFGAEFNEALVHQVLTAYLAGARAGTKAQKNRSDVRGGGKKPWRQKGTGRARAGTIRSPIWVGGGHTFAARPRDFSQKVNRKMYRAGMRSILAELNRQERLLVVDKLELKQPKTKLLNDELSKLDAQGALIVVDQADNNLSLAARNIPYVEVVTSAQVGPVDLVGHDKVVITAAAIKKLEGWLS